ncbi:hypothetical protein OF387_17125 [Lentilactobacillus hilgardii]|nr:hypothetical protein [Lentilactobacillus hilgardii]MCV3742960.1 hypothetical protein [Lentilactobacillus hilgardii]
MAAKRKTTAEQKVDSAISKYTKTVDKYHDKYDKARSKVSFYQDWYDREKNPLIQKQIISRRDAWKKVQNSAKNAYSRNNTKLKTYKNKKLKFDKERAKNNLSKIASKIGEHSKKVDAGENEGKVAMYRSDGRNTDVVYLATTGGESDDTTTDVSSWARDSGSPAHNYARTSAKSITASGVITGKTDHESREKLNKLLTWNGNHYELTYKGKIYYKHLLLTDINRTYDDYATDIKVSLTFQFSYAAKVTASTGTKKTNKNAKATVTLLGNRNKTYKALTYKSSMGVTQISKIYGKSAAWLKLINKNRFVQGLKIRVR